LCDFSEKRLRDAYERLKKRGIPLASNQVNYSLIYRAPEQTGVKAACDELGVTLIAYSPIAQGNLPLSPLRCVHVYRSLEKLHQALIVLTQNNLANEHIHFPLFALLSFFQVL